MRRKVLRGKAAFSLLLELGKHAVLCAARGSGQSSPGPFPQPCIDLHTSSLPTLPASLMGIRPVQSQSPTLKRTLGIVHYAQILNISVTFKQQPQIFILHLTNGANSQIMPLVLPPPDSKPLRGKESVLLSFASPIPNPVPDRQFHRRESTNIRCTKDDGNYREPFISQH